MKRQRDIDEYLRMYPGLEKWLNRCSACGARGTRPDLPENIHRHWSAGADHLRKMFRPMELSSRGRCEQCERVDSR